MFRVHGRTYRVKVRRWVSGVNRLTKGLELTDGSNCLSAAVLYTCMHRVLLVIGKPELSQTGTLGEALYSLANIELMFNKIFVRYANSNITLGPKTIGTRSQTTPESPVS